MNIVSTVVREAAGSIAFEDNGEQDGSSWTIRDIAAEDTEFTFKMEMIRRVNVQRGTALTGILREQIIEAYKRHKVIIPCNTDNGCFYYALAAAILYYKKKLTDMMIRQPIAPEVISKYVERVPVCKQLYDLGKSQAIEHAFMSIDEGEEFFKKIQEMIGSEFVLRVLQLELKSNG